MNNNTIKTDIDTMFEFFKWLSLKPEKLSSTRTVKKNSEDIYAKYDDTEEITFIYHTKFLSKWGGNPFYYHIIKENDNYTCMRFHMGNNDKENLIKITFKTFLKKFNENSEEKDYWNEFIENYKN